MNDTSIIDTKILNRNACLNTLVYLSEYYDGIQNGNQEVTVNLLVKEAENKINIEIEKYIASGHSLEEAQRKFGGDLRKVAVLENAIERDPGLGKLVIGNETISVIDPKTGFPYGNSFYACTFQDSQGDSTNVTVVFRGTGAFEWYDNGLGLSGILYATQQQQLAVEYFDYIVDKNGWADSTVTINVTGHSKGGNKAQYVVMASRYSEQITSGYSMDGQNMSQEAISYIREHYGEDEFEKRRRKLFSVSADNDYINILGMNDIEGRLVPAEQVFYLKSNLNFLGWHYPDCYINADGTLTDFTEQGHVSKFFQGISESLMDLPAPIRSTITQGTMGIAELIFSKGETINEDKISYADIMVSIPMLAAIIPGGVIEYLGNEYGVDLEWLSSAVTAAIFICLAPKLIIIYGIGKCVDMIIVIKEKMIEFGETCKEVTDKFVTFIDNSIKQIQNWYNETFNSGYKYAMDHPYVKIDTFKLLDYSTKICEINCRIASLDERLDTLYSHMGVIDSFNLMGADLLTGFNWKLLKLAACLADTVGDYERIEKELVSVE